MLSANFSKFKYLIEGTSEDYSKNKTHQINTLGTGRGGRVIFGGCGRFGGGRGCGGRGRV